MAQQTLSLPRNAIRHPRSAARLELTRLESIGAIRQAARGWDRLWERSDVALSTARAELTATWLEHFTPREPISTLVVEQGGRPVAVLPLVERRLRGMLPVGDLPMNCWSPNGELLLDPEADTRLVMDRLAEGFVKLRWPLVCFDMVPIRTDRWRNLAESLRRRGLAVDVRPRYAIGLTDIRGQFEDYFATRSRNHRQGLRKKLRRLRRDGSVELRNVSEFSDGQIGPLLQRGFEIEQKSWKREAGGTVLGMPGMFEFYHRQASQLATWGALRMAFLEHRGEAIAFELGWTTKGVYHCLKVGYDPAFASISPGQLLRMLLIERLHETSDCTLVDYQGPMTDAVARWSTRSYEIGQMTIAPPRTASRAIFAARLAAAGMVRRLRPKRN